MVAFVLLCIFALIMLLLLMRLRLFLSFKDGLLIVKVGALFIKFRIFGEERRKIKLSDFKIRKFRRRRDKALKKYRITSAPKKDIKRAAKKKKSSVLVLIKDLKDVIIDAVRSFGKYLKIDRFILKINVGGADAAKVAQNYGYVIQSIQYLVTFLEQISNLDKIKRKKAEVNADFTNEKWDARVDIALSIRVLFLLKIAFDAFIGFIKHKMKKKPQDAVNQ